MTTEAATTAPAAEPTTPTPEPTQEPAPQQTQAPRVPHVLSRVPPQRAARHAAREMARQATERLVATRQASQQTTPEPAQVETTATPQVEQPQQTRQPEQAKPQAPRAQPATPEVQKPDPTTERYRQEVAQLQQRVAEYERNGYATQAQRTALAEYQRSTEYALHVRTFKEIQESERYGDVSEGTAQDYWDGVNAQARQYVQQRTSQALGEYDGHVAEQRRTAEFRESFISQARGMSEVVPAAIRALPQYGEWFEHAVNTMDRLADDGQLAYIERIADPSRRLDELHVLFQQVLHRQLIQRPEVQALRPRAKPASQPKPAPVPPAPAPPAARQATPTASPLRPASPGQLLREARQATRELARRHFGG